MAANDTVITVVALGKVNNFIDDVHVTPASPIALLSEDSLRSKGLWVFNPPSLPTSGEFVSAYICDQDGQVIITANQDKLVGIFAEAPGIIIDMTFQGWHSRQAEQRRSNRVKGFAYSVFYYLQQWLGHPGLTTMCYMADRHRPQDHRGFSSDVCSSSEALVRMHCLR